MELPQSTATAVLTSQVQTGRDRCMQMEFVYQRMSCLQGRLDELESELMQVNANSERLQKSHSELLELQLVLERAGSFFTDAQSHASSSSIRSGGNADGVILISGYSAAAKSTCVQLFPPPYSILVIVDAWQDAASIQDLSLHLHTSSKLWGLEITDRASPQSPPPPSPPHRLQIAL